MWGVCVCCVRSVCVCVCVCVCAGGQNRCIFSGLNVMFSLWNVVQCVCLLGNYECGKLQCFTDHIAGESLCGLDSQAQFPVCLSVHLIRADKAATIMFCGPKKHHVCWHPLVLITPNTIMKTVKYHTQCLFASTGPDNTKHHNEHRTIITHALCLLAFNGSDNTKHIMNKVQCILHTHYVCWYL